MKRSILAIAVAAIMLLACVPALAFTGVTTDPGMPTVTAVEDAFFPIEVKRVENEPEVTENEWGEEVYTWKPVANDSAIAAGDTVTLSIGFTVPAAIEGFTDEQLKAIELLFTVDMTDNSLVMAFGCDPNYECDFEAGFCYPLEGYGNASMTDNVLTVDAHLGTTVQLIVQGKAASANVNCKAQCTIGQYRLPTHFSVGNLYKNAIETGVEYFVYFKDTFNVQMRGMKFIAVDGVFDRYYVHLNNHDYMRVDNAYVEVVNGETVGEPISEGDTFTTLETAYNQYMTFFGFTDDEVKDVMTDGVFLKGITASSHSAEFLLGEETDEPTPPTPPVTGCVSLAILGMIAVAGGIGVVAFRKKND